MEHRIDIVGDVIERQELLDGTRAITIEGRSADGRWQLTGVAAWNLGLTGRPPEGDVILARSDGSEVFATLVGLRTATDEQAVLKLELAYAIDGGAGEFEGVAGTGAARALLEGGAFRGVWTLSLVEAKPIDTLPRT